LWAMEKSMFFRLGTRAPRTTMLSVDIWKRDRCNPGGLRQNRHSVTRGLRRGYRIFLLYGTGDMGQAESLFLNDEGEQRSQSHTGRQECDRRRNIVAELGGSLRITTGRRSHTNRAGHAAFGRNFSMEKFLSRSLDATAIG